MHFTDPDKEVALFLFYYWGKSDIDHLRDFALG